MQEYTFKDSYFFSNEPGYYKYKEFGVRLKNVLEVIDTGKQHPSGSKFLAFKDVTLVPYEPKLIERSILSTQEVGPLSVFRQRIMNNFDFFSSSFLFRSFFFSQQKRWLNEYNAKIRDLVGDELKKQKNMQAFYWMMNKTRQ